jgi:hypothetical protein
MCINEEDLEIQHRKELFLVHLEEISLKYGFYVNGDEVYLNTLFDNECPEYTSDRITDSTSMYTFLAEVNARD